MESKDRLIVALDVLDLQKAIDLIDKLSPYVDIFKVGMGPHTAFGDQILKKLNELEKKVFLDLKFHDIPNTVKNATLAAFQKNIFMMNFHCLGGKVMLKAATDALNHIPENMRPLLIGVTVLTSMNDEDLSQINIEKPVNEQVLALAKLAKDAGLNGVVASSVEASIIKEKLGSEFLIITPGIRPQWAASNDQKRVLTPSQAIAAGADFLVVGRPIIQADDPVIATQKMLKEMDDAVKC